MFGKGIRVMRLFGIDIVLDYSWFLIFVFLVWLYSDFTEGPVVLKILTGALGGIMFFGSVLFHELAHSLVAKTFFKIRVPKIELFMLGGLSHLDLGEKKDHDRPWQEFAISVVGPLSSVLLGLLIGFVVFLSRPGYANIIDIPRFLDLFLPYLAVINFLLAGFNMIPAFPMDGGRVFRSFYWAVSKNQLKATRVSTILGKYFGIAFIAYGILSFLLLLYSNVVLPGNLMFVLLGFFLKTAAEGSWNAYLFDTKVKNVLSLYPSISFGPGNPRDIHCRPDDSIGTCLDRMKTHLTTRLPVFDDQGNCLGFIGIGDINMFVKKHRI